VDVGFAVLDAGGAALDSAHAAHATPLCHCGLAYWQEWAPALDLDSAFEGCSAPSPRRFLDDVGDPVDFILMSPALVAAAVYRSVDSWRARRVISVLPTIADGPPDLPPAEGANSLAVLVGRPVARLLKGQGRPPRTVPKWSGQCGSMLLSAATGGQWPQVRLARLRNADGVEDRTCQLCGAALGAHLHRRVCESSLPPDGWPRPPDARQDLRASISEARAALLRARGFRALRMPHPPAQEEVAARWFTDPPDVTRDDLVWNADGSMKFGPLWEIRRAGCGIAVVSDRGVRAAAAAELWAVSLVLTIALAPLRARADCQSILSVAAAGTAQAAKLTLAWIPAHGAQASIGFAARSDGVVVATVDRPANRSVGTIGKAAAGCPPQCSKSARLFQQALVAHDAAALGAVAHAANNHVREPVGPGGAIRRVTARGAAAVRRPRLLARADAQPRRAPPATQLPAAVLSPPAALPPAAAAAAGRPRALGSRRAELAAAARAASAMRAAAADAATLAICAARAAAARPSSAPPAGGRLAALR
ncbi:unnamed protein product, partial [Prorocentrum cordatum]